MSDDRVILSGLDGATPLGFLAALGVLRVMDSWENDGVTGTVSLAWSLKDRWRPVLHCPADLDDVLAAVSEDAANWETAPVLRFRYPKLEKRGPKLVGALRPPVAILRQWLRERIEAGDLESLDYVAALTAETATEAIPPNKRIGTEELEEHRIPFDPVGRLDRATMATAFDFTSRNAQFLEQVDHLRAHLGLEDFARALRDGTAAADASRTLDWDSTADAPGAIYSRGTAGSRPAAEWLAFRGLAFFPVAGRGELLSTTACRGRRKDGEFIWPLWEPPVDVAVAASLVRYPELDKLAVSTRRELGITQVFKCALTKKADGYNGMFAPSEPV